MIVETLGSLKIIADLFQGLSGQLDRLKGTPKKQLAQSLISLHEILKKVDDTIDVIFQCIKAIKESESVENRDVWRSKTIHALQDFGALVDEFTEWINKHEHFSNMLDLLHPEASAALKMLGRGDPRVRRSIFGDLKLKLGINDYDPLSRINLSRIKRELGEIKRITRSLVLEIRKVSVRYLNMEDIF
jgi:hypothetical protein